MSDEESNRDGEQKHLSSDGYICSRRESEQTVIWVDNSDDDECAEFREEVDGFVGCPSASEAFSRGEVSAFFRL